MDSKKLRALAESIRAQTVWEASPGVVVKLMDCSDGIGALLDKIERLETQWEDLSEVSKKAVALAEHWKANHDHQVSRARFLIERGDIPLERVRAYEEMEALRTESSRYRWATELEDNAETLYAAVMNNAPNKEAIGAAVDAAMTKRGGA